MFRSYASMARLSFYDTSGLLRVLRSRNPDTHSHIVVLRNTLMLMCVRGTNPVSHAHASMAASGLCPWYHIIRHYDLQAAVSAEFIDIRVIHDLQALSALHFLIKPLCFPEINAVEFSPCLVR